ncbi:hypothetical protein [Streptomyces sp. CBMA29]|uniref:hypothetical protein n=1 Tax=Streptomyces sp. CBMA29 TaxID=1896314 RepID=UPI0016621281|nr:hypothetical protein [Streptomyces sp. CBMA29]MBD0736585.1 hypothetical protein [Streptomyces sp. CBMA29]
MIVAVIAGCEIGFWLLLAAGLTLRYPLRRPRAGALVLAAVPLVDLVLLVVTVLDLRRGATADVTHGLAAAYIGFSVGYGHYLIRWADVRFAHRFAGAPAPAGRPKYGRARARHEWSICARTAVASAVAVLLLQLAVWYVDAPARTDALHQWQLRMAAITVINALVAATYTLWPKRPPAPERAER